MKQRLIEAALFRNGVLISDLLMEIGDRDVLLEILNIGDLDEKDSSWLRGMVYNF